LRPPADGCTLKYAYFVYDGNESTGKENIILKNFKVGRCPHFSDSDVGDPVAIEL
jgi:hypothetical protein